MVISAATTVSAYLAELPSDKRLVIAAVRAVILANLDRVYQEAMQYGMIGYSVPLSVYPGGCNGDAKQPLPFAALAAQKAHCSLYLMGTYCGCGEGSGSESPEARWFRAEWKRSAKKLDMGKACVRFRRLDDVALEVVGQAIARLPAAEYIARYEASRRGRKR